VFLWRDLAVSVLLNIPQKHHRVVFVNRVVTMQRVGAGEITEAEEELRPFVLDQSDHIFSPPLNRTDRVTLARENLMLFEMDVNGVLPVAG
jgi:hypothetical protein